tara:strand:- start:62 stop:622 length:561 start_codon:yes stop_codon:yes gene_type:complete
MPYYNYYCVECDKEDLRHIPLVDDVFTEQVLVSSLSQEEIDALPDWDDPRDYEVYKEVKYGDMPPDDVECSCGGTAERLVDGAPSIKHGRNSYQALKARQKYHMDGMDKSQAEKFYKESCEASKDRIKSGDQHYKRVVPNWKVLEKEGKVKRVDSGQATRNRELLKQTNIQLTRDGTLGKAARKKP